MTVRRIVIHGDPVLGWRCRDSALSRGGKRGPASQEPVRIPAGIVFELAGPGACPAG